jgi:hypothetical protein
MKAEEARMEARMKAEEARMEARMKADISFVQLLRAINPLISPDEIIKKLAERKK